MKAVWNGHVIAQSEETVIVENNHYFPIDSLNRAYFSESPHTTFCFWKGTASYFTINVDGKVNENAAWYYSIPKPKAAQIKDRVAFWHGVEVYV